MPTVIDSLVLELGLDSSRLDAAQRKALANFAKTKDQAVKTGSAIEAAGKSSAAAINAVAKEALALFAVLVGARGLKDFVADVTTSNAVLGRFATNLAQAPQLVAGWGMAAQRMGGSADATRQTFEKLSSSLYDLHQNGQMLPKEFYQLQALTDRKIDTEAGLPKFLNDTAAALQQLNKVDPQKAHFMARGMGIDDATANYMMKMGPAANSFAKTLGESLGPSDKAIASAQALLDKWVTLQQQASSLGNAIVSDLTPHLAPLLDQLNQWVADNKEWLASEITGDVEQLAKNLGQIDWQQIGKDIHSFAGAADDAAHAVGGWTSAATVLFGLWTGAQFAKVAANVASLAGAAGRVAAPGAAAGAAAGGRSLAYRVGTGIGVLGGAAAVGGLAYEADKQNIFADPTKGSGGVLGALARAADPTLARLLGFKDRDDLNADGVKVEGQQVSKANPLPVTAVGSNNDVTGRGIGGSTGSGLTPGGGGSATTPSGGNPSLPSGSTGAARGDVKGAMGFAMDQLRKEGVPESSLKYAAAALVGNAMAESGLNPNANHDIDPRTGRPTGHGIYGARYDRWTNMDAWTRQNGFGANSLEGQVREMAHRAMTDPRFARTRQALMYANKESVGGATIATMSNFESPGNPRTGARLQGASDALRAAEGIDSSITPRNIRPTGTTPSFGVTGASGAATLQHVSNDNRATTTSTSTSTSDVKIGTVNVNAPNATDARGVAAGMKDELGRSFSTATSNYGPR